MRVFYGTKSEHTIDPQQIKPKNLNKSNSLSSTSKSWFLLILYLKSSTMMTIKLKNLLKISNLHYKKFET
jgi:hypothetical protein